MMSESQQGWKSLIWGPIAGLVYFVILISAFAVATPDVFSEETGPSSRNFGDHWIYQVFSELVSIFLATAIVAALARKDATKCGILAGFAIAVVHVLALIVLWQNTAWNQALIIGLFMVAAPFIGWYVGAWFREQDTEPNIGIQSISRYHLLWLWAPLWFYTMAIVPSLFQLWIGPDSLLTRIGNFVVLALYTWFLWTGLGYLSGKMKSDWPRWKRELVGATVLIGGVGVMMALGWTVLSVLS